VRKPHRDLEKFRIIPVPRRFYRVTTARTPMHPEAGVSPPNFSRTTGKDIAMLFLGFENSLLSVCMISLFSSPPWRMLFVKWILLESL